MELSLVSPAADGFLLLDLGSLSHENKCAEMDSPIVILPPFPPLTALFDLLYTYALALDCTGTLVWGLGQFIDYVD